MKETQNIYDITHTIGIKFGLQEQAKELAACLTMASGCRRLSLLFIDGEKENYTVLYGRPKTRVNPFYNLSLNQLHPVIKHLELTQKMMTGKNLAAIQGANISGERDSTGLNSDNVKLILPIISRGSLIGLVILGEKGSGQYSYEESSFLQGIIDSVAVCLEKEYISEQLTREKEELSVINRSSAIMASSLDIQLIFDSFVKELRKIVKIDWASVNLIATDQVYLLAVSSEIGSEWKTGDHIPTAGSASEWLVAHRRILVEPDIRLESRFATADSHLNRGIRSIIYLPLLLGGRTIGTMILACRQANAYSSRQVKLLEQLTSQIIMPIKNSQLYAEVEEKSRIDGLTRLFNRRSFDERMASETGRYTRYGGTFSLIMADIDSLKTVNDTYGHLTGDEAIRQCANIIKKTIRVADMAFRFGGEEFAILLPNTATEAAMQVAERIRSQIASAIVPGSEAPITVSLGLASWPANGKTANAIIGSADAALYDAKRNGGNKLQRA